MTDWAGIWKIYEEGQKQKESREAYRVTPRDLINSVIGMSQAELKALQEDWEKCWPLCKETRMGAEQKVEQLRARVEQLNQERELLIDERDHSKECNAKLRERISRYAADRYTMLREHSKRRDKVAELKSHNEHLREQVDCYARKEQEQTQPTADLRMQVEVLERMNVSLRNELYERDLRDHKGETHLRNDTARALVSQAKDDAAKAQEALEQVQAERDRWGERVKYLEDRLKEIRELT